MKTLALFLFSAAVAQANPPRYALTPVTQDGGGGRAVSARYALTGTIGQAEAAPRFTSANNRYAITPGFWGAYQVIQQEGLPLLTIRQGAPGFVILAWPIEENGFTLQESPSLLPGSWTTVTTPVVDTPTEHTVTLAINGGKMFFRLAGN